MSKIETFACDVCGVHKKAANHWFKGYVLVVGGLVCIPWETGLHIADLVDGTEAHLCGAECVSQWVSRNLLS